MQIQLNVRYKNHREGKQYKNPQSKLHLQTLEIPECYMTLAAVHTDERSDKRVHYYWDGFHIYQQMKETTPDTFVSNSTLVTQYSILEDGLDLNLERVQNYRAAGGTIYRQHSEPLYQVNYERGVVWSTITSNYTESDLYGCNNYQSPYHFHFNLSQHTEMLNLMDGLAAKLNYPIEHYGSIDLYRPEAFQYNWINAYKEHQLGYYEQDNLKSSAEIDRLQRNIEREQNHINNNVEKMKTLLTWNPVEYWSQRES